MIQWNNIINDNTSGSAEIVKKTITLLESIANSQSVPDLNILKEQLQILIEKNPQFLVLHHFVDRFNSELPGNTNDNSSRKDLSMTLSDFLNKYRKRWDNYGENLAKNILDKIELNKKTILLHSNSHTVFTLFEALKHRQLDITLFQTSSAPVNEGKLQAEKLAELGYNMNYITEAAIGRFMSKIDYVFLGADAIFDERFLNKTGSLQLALTAKYFNKAVYVIADSRKYLSDIAEHSELIASFTDERLKPEEELWKDPPERISVLNYYFEFVPNDLVDGFFFERPIHILKK